MPLMELVVRVFLDVDESDVHVMNAWGRLEQLVPGEVRRAITERLSRMQITVDPSRTGAPGNGPTDDPPLTAPIRVSGCQWAADHALMVLKRAQHGVGAARAFTEAEAPPRRRVREWPSG